MGVGAFASGRVRVYARHLLCRGCRLRGGLFAPVYTKCSVALFLSNTEIVFGTFYFKVVSGLLGAAFWVPLGASGSFSSMIPPA